MLVILPKEKIGTNQRKSVKRIGSRPKHLRNSSEQLLKFEQTSMIMKKWWRPTNMSEIKENQTKPKLKWNQIQMLESLRKSMNVDVNQCNSMQINRKLQKEMAILVKSCEHRQRNYVNQRKSMKICENLFKYLSI